MVRKLCAIFVLALSTMLLATAAAAGTGSNDEQQANESSAVLASTGDELTLALWLGIGAVVLIGGIVLTTMSTRRTAAAEARP